jgi:hemoglobin
MRSTSQWWFLLLAVWGLGLNGLAAAQEKGDKPDMPAPLDRKVLDQHVYNTLRSVINHGANLYNSGDWNGCYRLYEGALMTLRPLLDHRPELQKAIDTGLDKAQGTSALSRRAFVLREVIDKVRADTKGPAVATLWDRLGGEKNVRKVVDDFADLAAKDEKVDFTRGGKYKPTEAKLDELKQKLVELISSVSGGPLKYTGKSMKEVHKGMGITDAQFDALADDLKKALEDNGAKPDDIKALLEIVGTTRKDIVEKKPDDK